MLKVGERAPNFTGKDQNGNHFSLSDLIGKKNIVLYFYPKDFTKGCTIETKSFASAYNQLRNLGAEVIGVSSDDEETHRKFASACGAEFPLVSDGDGSIRRLYDVKATLGLIPGRVTYIIDREGRIAHVFSSQLAPARHAEEAKRVLSELVEKQSRVGG
jgi:peroxiredoxin Q/BCP